MSIVVDESRNSECHDPAISCSGRAKAFLELDICKWRVVSFGYNASSSGCQILPLDGCPAAFVFERIHLSVPCVMVSGESEKANSINILIRQI